MLLRVLSRPELVAGEHLRKKKSMLISMRLAYPSELDCRLYIAHNDIITLLLHRLRSILYSSIEKQCRDQPGLVVGECFWGEGWRLLFGLWAVVMISTRSRAERLFVSIVAITLQACCRSLSSTSNFDRENSLCAPAVCRHEFPTFSTRFKSANVCIMESSHATLHCCVRCSIVSATCNLDLLRGTTHFTHLRKIEQF